MMGRLVYMIFNAYILGLIVYSMCTWVQRPTATKVRAWLHKWYDPVLGSLRRVIKPTQMGSTSVDFAPLAFLVGLVMARKLVVSLIVSPY